LTSIAHFKPTPETTFGGW